MSLQGKDRLGTAEEELERVRKALEASQREAAALKMELDNRSEQVVSLTAQLSAAKQRNCELERDYQAALKPSAEIAHIHTVEAALSQCKAELSSLQSQKDFFQAAYNAAKQEAGAHEAAEFRAKGEIRELQKALQVLWDGAASAARNAQAQDEQYVAEIKGIQKAKRELELAIEKERAKGKKDLETCKEAFETQIKALENELKTSFQAKEEITRLQNQVQTLEKDLASAQSTLVAHTTEAPDTKFARQHAAGLMDEVQTLQFQQDCTLDELKALRLQLRAAAEENCQAESQLERLRKEEGQREQQLSIALEEQHQMSGLLDRVLHLLPSKEKAVAMELVEASSELAAAEREKARLARKLGEMTDGGRETEEVSREVRAAEREVDRERRRVQELEREIEAVQLDRLQGYRSLHSGRPADLHISPYLSDSSKQRLASQRSPFTPKHLPNSLL
jgi:hypothetical protein